MERVSEHVEGWRASGGTEVFPTGTESVDREGRVRRLGEWGGFAGFGRLGRFETVDVEGTLILSDRGRKIC